MNTPDNYLCQLKFELNPYTPDLFKSQWFYIKYLTEYGIIDNYNFIILLEFMKNNFNLESNKNLIICDSLAGGFTSQSNFFFNKYFNFRLNYNDIHDDNIIINIYNSFTEKWTFQELDDIIFSFITSIQSFINSNYISYSIIIKNINLTFNNNQHIDNFYNNDTTLIDFFYNKTNNNNDNNENDDNENETLSDSESDSSTIRNFNIH